jgi:hypothetical protein
MDHPSVSVEQAVKSAGLILSYRKLVMLPKGAIERE